jgi:deoxyribodipyrimidine photo-lyase
MTPLEEQFYNYRPGISYPKPIIGPDYAATRARKKLHEVAKTPLAKEEATRILRIHVNPNGRRQRLRKRAGKEQGKSYQRGTQANQGR